MIQLTNDLVLIANSECYIVGKAGKSRGKGPELTNPKLLHYRSPSRARRACNHDAAAGGRWEHYHVKAVYRGTGTVAR